MNSPAILAITTICLIVGSPAQFYRIPGVQGPRAIGGFAYIIMLGGVQKELRLTADQTEKASARYYKQEREYGEIYFRAHAARTQEEGCRQVIIWAQKMSDESLAEFRKFLSSEQINRLKQIELQERGARAFTDPDVEKALHLTSTQKKTINELADNAQSRYSSHSKQREEFLFERRLEVRSKAMEKALQLLSPEQKKTWSAISGPVHDFSSENVYFAIPPER
jgi:hypothetical protein